MIIGLGTYSEKSLLPSLDKIGHPSHPLLKIGTTVHLGLIRSDSMLAHSLLLCLQIPMLANMIIKIGLEVLT